MNIIIFANMLVNITSGSLELTISVTVFALLPIDFNHVNVLGINVSNGSPVSAFTSD